MERLAASLTLLCGSGRAGLGRFVGSVITLYTRVPWRWLGVRGKTHVHGSELTVAGPAELQRMI